MFLFLVEPVSETLREPVTTFVLLLAIVLVTPPLFERFKLPGIVGLLAAGVLFGGSGLGWLNADAEIMKLFSEIGKIYLMFVAGLEIDLALFQKNTRSLPGLWLSDLCYPASLRYCHWSAVQLWLAGGSADWLPAGLPHFAGLPHRAAAWHHRG